MQTGVIGQASNDIYLLCGMCYLIVFKLQTAGDLVPFSRNCLGGEIVLSDTNFEGNGFK